MGTIALVAIVAGTVGWTVASTGEYTGEIRPMKITTQQITLKDPSGRTRIKLRADGGKIWMYNSSGRNRLRLESVGRIRFYNSSGNQSVFLGNTKNGARVNVYTSSGKNYVSVRRDTIKKKSGRYTKTYLHTP